MLKTYKLLLEQETQLISLARILIYGQMVLHREKEDRTPLEKLMES